MKNEVKKVESLLEHDEKTYNLSKNEALDRLKTAEVTTSEQMLNKWCRDGDIDAVRITTGAPKNRGLRISERSLDGFIVKKQGKVTEMLTKLDDSNAEIERLKLLLKEARQEIKSLKESGVVVKKEKTITLENFSLSADKLEAAFTYKRAQHTALFAPDTEEIIQIEKNQRGKGKVDVTAKFSDQEKEAILTARKAELNTTIQ